MQCDDNCVAMLKRSLCCGCMITECRLIGLPSVSAMSGGDGTAKVVVTQRDRAVIKGHLVMIMGLDVYWYWFLHVDSFMDWHRDVFDDWYCVWLRYRYSNWVWHGYLYWNWVWCSDFLLDDVRYWFVDVHWVRFRYMNRVWSVNWDMNWMWYRDWHVLGHMHWVWFWYWDTNFVGDGDVSMHGGTQVDCA